MGRLAHEDTGTGPPVVLLHGLTCHLGYWRRVVAHLDGLRVIAFDFRGHGLSAHADSYRYADYEHDLFAVMDAVGLETAPVAGHSLGGYVGPRGRERSDRVSAVLAIDVKSDWTDRDAAFSERSRSASQRVVEDRETLMASLARASTRSSSTPISPSARSRPSTAAGATAGTGASSPRSPSTRSRSCLASVAPFTSWPAHTAR